MQNRTEYVQKSSQNPPKVDKNLLKILPKSSQNCPRTFPELSFKTECAKKSKKIDFFNFKPIFGKARASQTRSKIVKIRPKAYKNRCPKKKCFSTSYFLDFSLCWPSKTIPKSMIFRIFFENVDFVKSSKKHRKNMVFIDFSGFDSPKIRSKSMPKRA